MQSFQRHEKDFSKIFKTIVDFFFSILNVLDVNNTLVFFANSFFEVLSMFAFDRSVPRNKRIWNSNPKWPMLERNTRYVTDYFYIFWSLCMFVCVWETWYYLITTMQLFTPLKKILICERFEVVSSSFFDCSSIWQITKY